jgi:hypothetical protein
LSVVWRVFSVKVSGEEGERRGRKENRKKRQDTPVQAFKNVIGAALNKSTLRICPKVHWLSFCRLMPVIHPLPIIHNFI